MLLQHVLVFVIVAVAVTYLVWKLRGGSRPRARRKPDVPAARLVRKSRAKRSGCHD